MSRRRKPIEVSDTSASLMDLLCSSLAGKILLLFIFSAIAMRSKGVIMRAIDTAAPTVTVSKEPGRESRERVPLGIQFRVKVEGLYAEPFIVVIDHDPSGRRLVIPSDGRLAKGWKLSGSGSQMQLLPTDDERDLLDGHDPFERTLVSEAVVRDGENHPWEVTTDWSCVVQDTEADEYQKGREDPWDIHVVRAEPREIDERVLNALSAIRQWKPVAPPQYGLEEAAREILAQRWDAAAAILRQVRFDSNDTAKQVRAALASMDIPGKPFAEFSTDEFTGFLAVYFGPNSGILYEYTYKQGKADFHWVQSESKGQGVIFASGDVNDREKYEFDVFPFTEGHDQIILVFSGGRGGVKLASWQRPYTPDSKTVWVFFCKVDEAFRKSHDEIDWVQSTPASCSTSRLANLVAAQERFKGETETAFDIVLDLEKPKLTPKVAACLLEIDYEAREVETKIQEFFDSSRQSNAIIEKAARDYHAQLKIIRDAVKDLPLQQQYLLVQDKTNLVETLKFTGSVTSEDVRVTLGPVDLDTPGKTTVKLGTGDDSEE